MLGIPAVTTLNSQDNTVLVLGGRGMLGHMVVRRMGEVGELRVKWTSRQGIPESILFDASSVERTLRRVLREAGPIGLVVNCIGMLRSSIDESDENSTTEAHLINSELPHQIAKECSVVGAKFINISTDAVFKNNAGLCLEDTPVDPEGLYGLSKLRGEVLAENALNIRCSILGPDPYHGRGLIEWCDKQQKGSIIQGFLDQLWVGATTVQVADLLVSLTAGDLFDAARAEGPIHHLCPLLPISKAELLRTIVQCYKLELTVDFIESGNRITRRLDTSLHVLASIAEKYGSVDKAVKELAVYTTHEGYLKCYKENLRWRKRLSP